MKYVCVCVYLNTLLWTAASNNLIHIFKLVPNFTNIVIATVLMKLQNVPYRETSVINIFTSIYTTIIWHTRLYSKWFQILDEFRYEINSSRSFVNIIVTVVSHYGIHWWSFSSRNEIIIMWCIMYNISIILN